ncbi:MAG: SDR family oxidoreductase [Candidatus Fermentibacteraceae bacterium]
MGGCTLKVVKGMETLHAIIGVSSALGRQLAFDLISKGRTVAGTYNSSRQDVPGVDFLMKCNVTSENDIKDFAAACKERSQQIVLTYFAGVSRNAYAHKLLKEDWDDVLQVCLTGAFLAAKEFLPTMRTAQWGRIIYAGSLVGRIGVAGTSAYSAAKEGLKGFVRTIAKENGSMGVTANYIELGYMNAGLTYTIPESIQASLKESIPTNRFGDLNNLFEVVRFIEAADYLNGSVITVSGGL